MAGSRTRRTASFLTSRLRSTLKAMLWPLLIARQPSQSTPVDDDEHQAMLAAQNLHYSVRSTVQPPDPSAAPCKGSQNASRTCAPNPLGRADILSRGQNREPQKLLIQSTTVSRAIHRIIVLTMLGTLTACAIAWVFAMQTSLHGSPRYNIDSGSTMFGYDSADNGQIWLLALGRTTGVIELSIGRPPTDVDITSLRVERMLERSEVPSWSIMRQTRAPDTLSTRWFEQGFGWPMICLAQRHEFDPVTDRITHTNAIRMPRQLRQRFEGSFLPLVPIWPGLLINAALFGWLWFVVLACPIMCRKRLRKFRGRCPDCGYNRRKAASDCCPECGALGNQITPRPT